MALTFGDFLSIFTTNDASGGRAIKATFDSGIDDAANYLTKNDPAGGRAIKVVNVGAPLGPQFWTEAYNTGTQATSSWTPTGAATDINAAIRPKGTGAITAAIPDGTVTGGNARGIYAVDLQMVRNTAARVASGTYSAILSGTNNTASGDRSVVLGGNFNSSSSFASIAGGESNNAYGSWCVALGDSNSANGYGGIALGRGNNLAGGGGGDRGSFAIGFGNYCTYSEGGGALGKSNTANSFNAIAIGQSSTASANVSFAIGNTCTASAVGSVSIGNSNTVSGTYSNIAGGSGNTISGSGYSTIAGGQNNSINQGSQSWQFIGGGSGNQVLNGYGVVCGGVGNIAGSGGGFTHGQAFVGGGEGNRAQQEYAAVVGGRNNNSVGGDAFIGGGRDNRASGGYSSIVGGFQGTAFLYGQTSHASGQFSARGDAQAHELVWRAAVTGTAQTELFLDGASAAAILPSTNAIWHGVIDVAAVCTATGDGTTIVGHVEATSYKVTIKRIGTTTSLVGTVQEIGTTNADGSMATAAITIDNNDTNESLRIRFTPPGTAGSTTVIRVVATFRGLQIQY